MEKSLFALEYRQGKEEGCFHYNMVFEKEFDHKLLTSGYHPIMIISEKVADNRGFLDVQSRLSGRNATVEEVINEVYHWAARHPELW